MKVIVMCGKYDDFDPKIDKKSGFLPLHFNWQLMAMVFDPNFGKNMNN